MNETFREESLLLLHAAAFGRLGDTIREEFPHLRVVLMEDDGLFSDLDGETLDGDPQPDIGFANTDVFFCKGAMRFFGTLAATEALKWVQCSAAGFEHPAIAMIARKAERFTNDHAQADAMAEWALWQALDFFRKGPLHRAQARSGKYRKTMVSELNGSRWLIYGYGSIGQAVGTRVTALGGEVTGVRRTTGPAEGAARVITPDKAIHELGEADVVLLSLPHNDHTDSMADAAFFAAMKPGALLLNLGRGGLIDEDALLRALDAGELAHAALDVTREEPLPEDSPLWRHPKITITPHDSAWTPQTRLRNDRTFLDNLRRYIAGEPLKNVVAIEALGVVSS